jgi:transcriptional regulator with XRE-family HTH domain
MASTPNGDRSRAVQLGAELRDARRRARSTVEQVAKALGYHHSTISRWERGESMPSEADTASVLVVLGVTGEERDQLVELARHDDLSDWVAPGIGKQLAALMDGERTARAITEVNPLLIPGLLQTADYCRAIMTGGGSPQGQIETGLVLRMGRQNVLTRQMPVSYVAIIGELAIRYPACESEIMLEQLHHLLTMAQRSNIDLHVLPLKSGYSLALEGRFVLLEFDRSKPVVQVDSCYSTSTITNDRAVDNYQAAAESIRHDALDSADSIGLIKEIMKDRESEA